MKHRRDLLHDPKGHSDLCGWFDLEVAITSFMTKKVTATFVVGLT